MVQLSTKKTALALYGVLLILPTGVLAGLHWRELERDHRQQMEEVPREVADAARRLSAEIEKRVQALLERESARPFYVYRDVYFPAGTIGAELAFVPSPLAEGPAPEGVLAWFSHDLRKRTEDEPRILGANRGGSDDPQANEARLRSAVLEILEHDWQDGYLKRITRFGRWRAESLPATIAAINLHTEENLDCLRQELTALRELAEETMQVNVSAFHLRFYRETDGTPRIAATRRVLIEGNKRLREVPTCIESMGWGATLVQGFFIDPSWYFHELPLAAAEAVLDPDHLFMPAGGDPSAPRGEVEVAAIRPVELLRCETYDERDLDFGRMEVAMNTSAMEARFRRQSLRFLGVAGMLFVSLGTGLWLLMRSVHRDLEQAQRTENFVAAVTHELRTPLSAIKLYGEMLADGWVKEDEKREEYYRRIVRESDRLETLVERVLEQGRVVADEAPPEPGDLNQAVVATKATLTQIAAKGGDLVFDLGDDLPPVLLVPDAVRSILINLVENARKYAPFDPSDARSEPIAVRTRLVRGKVVLEVLDRGRGIPPAERSRVFEAFYRIGNEATRTSSGTGLGLHLVALHMRAMRGRVQVLDRKGGGTAFRMTFRTAAGGDADLGTA